MGYNDELTDTVVIDLETCATPDVASWLDVIKPPGNYKDPDKILNYQLEKLQERITTASLEPDLCEIVALGYLRPDQQEPVPQVKTRKDEHERRLLEWFWQSVWSCRLVGFNILSFDLPVLIRRSQLLDVRYPALNLDRYRTPHVDVLDRLSFQGKLTYRSLNFYARRFGVVAPDPVVGADIPGLVAAGLWDAVRDHCACDIAKTAQLAARLGWFKTVVQADVA